jgi:formate hydrogenlyase subunit 3/multisubunit Na+/H+ antiporter MnhD subunit
MPQNTGKFLIAIGLVLIAAGVLFLFKEKLPFLNQIGRLPGDINYQKDGFTFSFPIVTCLILSVLVSIVLRLFRND